VPQVRILPGAPIVLSPFASRLTLPSLFLWMNEEFLSCVIRGKMFQVFLIFLFKSDN